MPAPGGTGGLKYRSDSQQVEYCRYDGSDDDPEKLEPVEERDAYELWLVKVVKGRIEKDNEGDEQEEQDPGTTPSFGTGNHNFSPFVSWHCQEQY
jgi:hypothetical protein